MIGISKLYCGTVEPSDALRYGRDSSQLPSHLLQFSKDKHPVVVWNVTRRCNLKCVHCYAHAKNIPIIGLVEDISTINKKERVCVMCHNSVILVDNVEDLKKEIKKLVKVN